MTPEIEKVAQAIHAAEWEPWNRDLRHYPDRQEKYNAMARAALEAIREPSEGMLEAGWRSSLRLSSIDDQRDRVKWRFTDMIDKALGR